jgi:O-antigen ligase/polysaccharide polymerase Wzy-like membrane protein
VEPNALRDLQGNGPGRALFYLCAFVVVAALVLGGGTRTGFLADVILQLLAVPLLLAALWCYRELPAPRPGGWALLFCMVLVAVPLLQAVPLPPEIWSKLPNRAAEIESLTLAGGELPWMPLSLAPQATLLSALSLVVPMAIFIATLTLSYGERSRLSLVILGVGIASVFLGLSQVAQGPSSPLRFFDFTNPTEAIGFFANRNHFSALLYALTLLAAAWAVDAALTAGSGPRRTDGSGTIALVISFTVLVALVAAQVMARSRAGLGLTIVALLGAVALAFADRRESARITPTRMFGAVVVAVVMVSTQFALYRVLERFTSDPLQDARIPFAKTTIEAARAFMPFGSGVGTFVPVYAYFEKPKDVLINTFANRAHNDALELWLETGVAGLALLAVFTAWFLWRAVAVWRHVPYGARELDGSLARAATLIVGLLIAHSLVDYPLRTGSMMAIFAFACALLVPPPQTLHRAAPARPRSAPQASGPAGHGPSPAWEAPPASWPQPPADLAPAAAPRTHLQWGEALEWPEEWQRGSGPAGPKPGGGEGQ